MMFGKMGHMRFGMMGPTRSGRIGHARSRKLGDIRWSWTEHVKKGMQRIGCSKIDFGVHLWSTKDNELSVVD